MGGGGASQTEKRNELLDQFMQDLTLLSVGKCMCDCALRRIPNGGDVVSVSRLHRLTERHYALLRSANLHIYTNWTVSCYVFPGYYYHKNRVSDWLVRYHQSVVHYEIVTHLSISASCCLRAWDFAANLQPNVGAIRSETHRVHGTITISGGCCEMNGWFCQVTRVTLLNRSGKVKT